MNVRLAIAKRRSKRLAAGVIHYVRSLGVWWVTLYSVADDTVGPFGTSCFDKLDDAMADANETLQVQDGDWIMVAENDVESHIREHACNRWAPSQYKRPK